MSRRTLASSWGPTRLPTLNTSHRGNRSRPGTLPPLPFLRPRRPALALTLAGVLVLVVIRLGFSRIAAVHPGARATGYLLTVVR
jgi:hypothetical protein